MIYWPFDSVVSEDGEGNVTYDRAFDSASLRKIFSMLYTNGVAMTDDSSALLVSPDSGMTVSVAAGMAIIEGAMGYQEEAATITLTAADSTYARIDTIVARLNTNLAGRSVTLELITGTAAASPAAPAITRSGNVYDLRLANIKVPAGATSITASGITDTRLGSECGIATARPEEVDTSSIFAQYQASLTEYMSYVQACMDDTVAGNLQNQITALPATILDAAYPVGSIYITTATTNPGTLFGGTWEQIEDRFLLAAGSSYTAGATGGEATHTLTAAEMPAHTHSLGSHKHTVPAHTHTASAANAGVHTHNINRWLTNTAGGANGRWYVANSSTDTPAATTESGEHTHTITVADKPAFDTTAASGNTGSRGSGGAHNNMPPYLVVYVWKRTA